jgi:hypothetical protein
VQRFIILQNIEHFRRLLGTVTDPQEQCAITELLAQELEKLPRDEREQLAADGPPPALAGEDADRSWS